MEEKIDDKYFSLYCFIYDLYLKLIKLDRNILTKEEQAFLQLPLFNTHISLLDPIAEKATRLPTNYSKIIGHIIKNEE